MASLMGVIILCVLHLCAQSIEGKVKPAIPDNKFLGQNQQNMATATKDTVWIGFMDIVPVIGTVKESVELVLAVYEGNRGVIKEKEKAIENIVKESFKKHVKRSTLPDKPAAAAAAAAAEFSGLRNVREVKMEKITEYMMKGSKWGIKPLTPAQQRERQKRLEAIQKDMLLKISYISLNFSRTLKEELEKLQRDKHVFNNDILTFHLSVLTEFIQRYRINNLRGYNQQAVNELGRHTLPPNTETDIRTNMVVHFGQNEFYMNMNVMLYDIESTILRDAIFDVLHHRNPDEVTEYERQWLNELIDLMNNHQAYVDELARDKWIDNRADRQARFEQVRQEVAHMYKTDRGVEWCIRILREAAPLFERRQ